MRDDPLKGFPFEVLDQRDYKEDAVREDIIAPILRAAGFGPTGSNRMVRSKALVHPFVMIGSKKHRVNIIPDYTLYVGDRPVLVLDAKRPSEDVRSSEHMEQAYSYALHPEVRAEHYGVSNGRRLLVHSVRSFDPVLDVDLTDPTARRTHLWSALSPRALERPETRDFLPDLGLQLRKMKVEDGFVLLLPDASLSFVAMVAIGHYTGSTTVSEGGDGATFAASLDFGEAAIKVLLDAIPRDVAAAVRSALTRQPFYAPLPGRIEFACVAEIGELTQGQHEQFVPFTVTRLERARWCPGVDA